MKKRIMTSGMAVSLWIMLASTGVAQGQDIAGDWIGTLQADSVQLRLALHFTKAADGSLTGIMDSPDQRAFGIPISSISMQGATMKFEVAAVHGSYNGKLKQDGSTITGTWSQGQSVPLDFKRGTYSKVEHKPAAPSDIDGAWMGTLDVGSTNLRVVFHLTNTAEGLVATMDSPDQGNKGSPATAVTRDGVSLKIEFKQIDGSFAGKINKDRTTIDGTWTQRGSSLPLVLKRVTDAAQLKRRRPQNPVMPYPYREEEVSYPSQAQGVTLAATLTIPPGKEPFPAVLLICGSGPHDRDESLLGHKPFLVLSDYLTRKGIVVLRADKRGVGQSTGNLAESTLADYATDAEAGVAYLKSRPEVDPQEIGLIGHSEGGEVAPMVAVRDPDVAFIVLMAGPGVPGSELIPQQVLLISEASGVSQQVAEEDAAKEREILTLVMREEDQALLEKELQDKLHIAKPQASADIKVMTSPGYRYLLSYDPATALRKVKCPVLAINGSKDVQVSSSQNLAAIRKALEEGGNRRAEIDQLPGLNHLFQTAKTGAPSEYAEIEETMSPLAMGKIASWILKQ